MNLVKRKLEAIQCFGISCEMEKVLLRIGIKKNRSFRNIMRMQRFYEELDEIEYPKYLKKWYYDATGNQLDLQEPQRFTEKIQWLKLYDSTPVKTLLADKYLVRSWVAEKIGEEHLIPLYGVWDCFENIDFGKLPDSFVLKCNHGSGMDIKVENKNVLNKKGAKKKFDQWMKIDFAFMMQSFELHYQDIPRKIIAEKYMKNGSASDLQDYKFYCFHGKPVYCQVICDRSIGETIDFFDMEWNHMSFVGLNPEVSNSSEAICKPKTFDIMKNAAEILSKEFSFVRVDLYEIEDKMYFGEMTFTPGAGSGGFRPDKMDFELGSMINLKKVARKDYD